MTPSNVISLVIAGISALIAALALYRSWRAERDAERTRRESNDLLARQVDLQERVARIEQSREQARILQALQAVLRAALLEIGRNNWRLVITNTGCGTARNVTTLLDGKPLLEHEAIPQGEQEAKLIGPVSEVSYCMALSFDCRPPFQLQATWDDDSGQKGKHSTTLTF